MVADFENPTYLGPNKIFSSSIGQIRQVFQENRNNYNSFKWTQEGQS